MSQKIEWFLQDKTLPFSQLKRDLNVTKRWSYIRALHIQSPFQAFQSTFSWLNGSGSSFFSDSATYMCKWRCIILTDGPSSSTTVIVMGAVIGILLISIIVFGSVVVFRKRYDKYNNIKQYIKPIFLLLSFCCKKLLLW